MTELHSIWYEPYQTENTTAPVRTEPGDNAAFVDAHIIIYTQKSLQRFRLRKVEEGEARCRRSTTTIAPKGLWDMSLQNRLFWGLAAVFHPWVALASLLVMHVDVAAPEIL